MSQKAEDGVHTATRDSKRLEEGCQWDHEIVGEQARLFCARWSIADEPHPALPTSVGDVPALR
jgi:hypothetical protein